VIIPYRLFGRISIEDCSIVITLFEEIDRLTPIECYAQTIEVDVIFKIDATPTEP
jgi:hypothetical protein